jgi:phosphoribosylanthranilate isomerase
MTQIKFCGMTRAEDAGEAAALGAAYVGVILTDGPRRVSPVRARAVFRDVPSSVKRVGVVGRESPEQITELATGAAVDVIQLHGDQDADTVRHLRDSWPGGLWWVARTANAMLPDETYEIAAMVDAVVLDARVAGQLGGTGQPLDWDGLVAEVDRLHELPARLVLAGGLTADNVRQAVALLRPHVVDVSSGVESAVGVKDHDRMRVFRDAVGTGEEE